MLKQQSLRKSGIIFILLCNTICFCSCTSYSNKLETYYNSNSKLHTEIADSLVNFCKRNHTNIYLKKYSPAGAFVHFNIYFKDISAYVPIEFDSALNRHDPQPGLTSKFDIPLNAIDNFNKSIYSSVMSDTGQTFFAYRQDNSSIFARDVSYIGIMITSDKIYLGKRISKLRQILTLLVTIRIKLILVLIL